LSWFSVSKFEHIHSRISESQDVSFIEISCNAIARSCYFHIRNIGCIRPFISEDACKVLVNALVTSRLDYGNALLVNLNTSIHVYRRGKT
jgi:hypothetical protein